ncbi:hypothetical protein [Paenibacillus wynnii]|nr:hypothetical protein [Paenibacillus wynnii]
MGGRSTNSRYANGTLLQSLLYPNFWIGTAARLKFGYKGER